MKRLSTTGLMSGTFIATMLFSAGALAHSGQGIETGLLPGLLHPLAGLDHLLAMLAVGLWAWHCGGRALWALPVAFVALMLLGGWMGTAGWTLPMAETAILASVVALGVITALGLRLPLVLGSLLVGSFGIFHGYAHGLEAGSAGSAFGWYAAGFALSTAVVHLTGIALGRGLPGTKALRWAGAATAVAGVLLGFA